MNDHLKKIVGFKGKSKISTRILRKSLVFQMKIKDSNQNVKKSICFQRKIKDFNDNLKKIIVFQRVIEKIRLQPPEDRFDDTFEKTPPRQECEKYAAKSRKCDRGARFL